MKISNLPDRGYFNTGEKVVREGKEKKLKQSISEIKDQYTSTEEIGKKATYEKPNCKVDKATIQRLKEETERNHKHLKEMVKQLLQKQGLTLKDLDGLETIKIDDETRIQAQALIEEGGPLSPEAVSDRIVDFAKAISGGDKEKIDILRTAIEKGFKEAERMLGGELPEISQTTYKLTMEKLDAWLEE